MTRMHHTTRRLALTFCILTLAALPSTAAAATLDVCASGCTYSTVASAVAAASSGDVVELANETFNEGGITISVNITIRSASGWATIDAGASNHHVFKISSGTYVDLASLKLEGGTSARIDNFGNVDLANVQVLGEGTASTYGGAVNRSNASMTIAEFSYFSGNKSIDLGGGLTNFGDLVIVGSTFNSNTGRTGGGFLNSFGTVSVMSSSFSSNSATFKGGAWANFYSGSSHGPVAFHGSSSAAANTGTVDCDDYWDLGLNPSCVD